MLTVSAREWGSPAVATSVTNVIAVGLVACSSSLDIVHLVHTHIYTHNRDTYILCR